MERFLLQAKIVCITAMASVTIFTNDHLPDRLRRRMLSTEYRGKDLEDRLAVRIFAGWSTVKAIYHMLSINMRPQLQIGQSVGNLKVLRLSSHEEVSLASMSTSATRPLVLNFEMQREYAGAADFAIIYLEEAHPTDGWMYGQVKHLTTQPVTIAERCRMAQSLAETLQSSAASASIALCVDRMDNGASRAFGALPERLAILKGGKLQFMGGAGPFGYSISACSAALKKLI